MTRENSIDLEKPTLYKAGEIIAFLFCCAMFVIWTVSFKDMSLLFGDAELWGSVVFGVLSVLFFLAIVTPQKIEITDKKIIIKHLPKFYKRLNYENIVEITAVKNEPLSLFKMRWYTIYSTKNLYLIATPYRNYYVNCTENSVKAMEALIRTVEAKQSIEDI